MGKHNFSYFLHEGLSNMFSHGFMSFAAIGITVACLLIMGTFTLVAVNADANLKQVESENEILAFIDDTYTEEQAKALQSKLEAVDNVASATFISREEAMETFISEHPDEEYFQDLDPNILRDRFAIKVKDLRKQSETVEKIRNVEGVGGISAYAELTNGFIAVRNIATVICVALIAVLFVISVFIISNTIKLTTFRLKGKGIPELNGRGRGDQYVTVYIETPRNLNREQKEALKKFAESVGDNNYEERKKFFKKFKK